MQDGRQEVRAFDRITFDRQVLGGRACIRGMRISVALVLNQLAHGATTADLLEEYPSLEAEDIEQSLEYAAWLASEEVVPA